MSSILFINTSPNHAGNTVRDVEEWLSGVEHDTLHLGDYRIDQYGVVTEDDQIGEVFDIIARYDTLVIGSPVYWHTIGGILKTFMDRWYMLPQAECLKGKTLYFYIQGAGPDEHCRATVNHLFGRGSMLMGMELACCAVGKEELGQVEPPK